MAENTTATPAPAAEPTKSAKIFCFVSKRDIDTSDAVEVSYTNGQKVWVGKQYIKFKQ